MDDKLERIQCVTPAAPIVVQVDVCGSGSLLGCFYQVCRQHNWHNDLPALRPSKIVFNIKQMMPGVDIFAELNAVRDTMGYDKSIIEAYISNEETGIHTVRGRIQPY